MDHGIPAGNSKARRSEYNSGFNMGKQINLNQVTMDKNSWVLHQWNTRKFTNIHIQRSRLNQQLGDSGSFCLRVIHERSNPRCAVNEFGCGDDVLHPAVFHLRQESESGYFCICHTAQEEDQRCSILPLMACTVKRWVSTNQYCTRHSQKGK